MEELVILGKNARAASIALSQTTGEQRNAALNAVASAIMSGADDILSANALDIASAKENGMTAALIDRLTLTYERLQGIANAIADVVALPDPIGITLSDITRPNGLSIKKLTVPIGVIAVIFEARPNVAVDSAALCLKSGNAVILRGGKEAINSNIATVGIMRNALASVGLPMDSVSIVHDTSRDSATALMRLNGYVDLLIPRGGQGLIKSVLQNATVPVIETGAGTCHTYVDRDADIAMAAEIVYNAKTSRPSVCNACECMLIHRDIASRALPAIAEKLRQKNVEIRGDEATRAIIPGAVSASDSDWGREYDDYIIASRVVDSMDDAISHITQYGTKHSECIITNNTATAEEFLSRVDAAAVYHNASTRFTDGGEFGLGAEIGISTQKLHARGPLGLRELTSMKYIVRGTGQIR